MKRLKNLISSYPIANKFFTDMYFRNKISLAMSLLLNIVYALWEVICGIYYRSPWFAALGLYYVLLTAARLILLREANNREGNGETGRKAYRNSFSTLTVNIPFRNRLRKIAKKEIRQEQKNS